MLLSLNPCSNGICSLTSYVGYYVSLEEPKNMKLLEQFESMKEDLVKKIRETVEVGYYCFLKPSAYRRINDNFNVQVVDLLCLQCTERGDVLVTARYDGEEATENILYFSMDEIFEIIKHIK